MSELLTAVALIFIAAGPLVLLANRLNVPSVPLLIVAGIIVGPQLDEARTLELARYGIALLVFVFGARIQFDAVRVVIHDSELVAIGQILGMGSLGVACAYLLGLPLDQVLFLGVAAALSSTIVGTTYIQADIRKNLVHGRLADSIHYVQDLIAIGIVLVVGAEVYEPDPIAAEIGYGVMLLVGAGLVYQYGFPLLERLAGGDDEPMLVGVIALLVAFLGLAELTEISIVVGAFAAGLAVRHVPIRHLGLFNGLESLRDFFVAIFFVTIGALVSYPSEGMLALALILGLLTALVKPALTFVLLILNGYESRSAALTSLSLDQVSEFTLIIAIEAAIIGVLTQEVFDAIILATAVTMVTSGFTHMYDEAIYRELSSRGLLSGRHRKTEELSTVPEELSDHVVIAGFGRQGRRLIEELEAIGQAYVVIENDPGLLEDVRSTCDACVFGDAMDAHTWELANVEEARLVISTVESVTVSRQILAHVDEPDVILRATTSREALDLMERGARYAYVDDNLAAQQLIAYIEAIETGEMSSEELREQYRDRLEDGATPADLVRGETISPP